MKKPTFFTGLLFGVLIGLIIWYWQKSTSAEDGALALLDRMAEQDARLRAARGPTAVGPVAPPPTTAAQAPPDEGLPSFLVNRATEPPAAAADLTVIHGVGPVFAGRLQEAGLTTIAAVAATAVPRLAAIMAISASRAEAIQKAARAVA